MKRFINFLFSLIIFVSLFLLTIVINLNFLFKGFNLKKINENIDYTELINLSGKNIGIENDLNNIYNNLILIKLDSKKIDEIYNSRYLKDSIYSIENSSINYLLYNKKYDALDENELNEISKKYSNDDDFNKAFPLFNKVLINFSMKAKESIDSIPSKYLKVIRFMFSNNFKIILITIITISCIILIFIDKEKFIPNIFVPTLILGILELFIVFFAPNLIYKYLDEFIYVVINPYLSSFNRTLLITSLIIMIVSVIYLAIYDRTESKSKIVLKKKIRNKNIE